MIAYCNFIPDTVWVREVENGIRRITIRRNFTEETVIRQEDSETQFRFEETDVFIPDRENIQEFVTENFGNLFDLGIQQTTENSEKEASICRTRQMVQEGTVADDLQILGQQITDIMLGV